MPTGFHGVIAVLALLSTPILAADWPEFRGPTGQGTADVSQLPVRWSETENVVWKIKAPGLGWSSPVVVGDRLFLTTAVPVEGEDAQSLQAICLAARTGDTLWSRELFVQRGPVEIHSKNSHASPTPLVSGDQVFVHFGPHGTAALSLDGDVLWKTNELKYLPTHGCGGSPALAGDRLIICCDGHDQQFITALSTRSGDRLWRTDRKLEPSKGFSFATPLVIDVNGRSQAICPGSEAVMAVDPATGEILWTCRYDGYSVVPRPVYAAGLVVVSSGYDEPRMLAIDPTGSGDVTQTHVKWSIDRGASLNPSAVIVGDDLYFVSDNGILSSVQLKTGKKHWQQRLGGAFSASLLYADGHLYVQDEHGKAYVIEPGEKFRQLAENELAAGERTFASYAAIDGALFIRSESHLYRIGATNPVAGR